MKEFESNKKDYIRHLKRYKKSSVIGIISCTIWAICTVVLLIAPDPIVLLLWMISGGIGGAVIEYQIAKEKERPMTEEELIELKEMFEHCRNELEKQAEKEGQIKPGS